MTSSSPWAIDVNEKVPGINSFPTTVSDIVANTFVRASYQKAEGTTGSLTTSVVASPSFRTDDGTFHYAPNVTSAAVVTNGPDYYKNTLAAEFSNVASVETIRRMSDPVLGKTTVQLETNWTATADIQLATADPFSANDRLRELTVSSMFSSETEFDANLIRWEDASGVIHSQTLTNNTARDSHLFDEPFEIGSWFELAKTTDSTWEPDSPTTRIRIVNNDGVRLGLQGFLAATLLTSDDSLSVWLEDLDSPDVIAMGTQRSLQFEMIATAPVPYDFGDAPVDYPSTLADNGVRHAVLNELFLGAAVGGSDDVLEIAGAWQGEDGAIVDDKFEHAFTSGGTTLKITNTKPWQNPILSVDVSRDGVVAPLDVLLIINEINAHGTRTLAFPQTAAEVIRYYDTNGDGSLAPIDVLLVVNFINDPRLGEGEGVLPFAASLVAQRSEPTWESLVPRLPFLVNAVSPRLRPVASERPHVAPPESGMRGGRQSLQASALPNGSLRTREAGIDEFWSQLDDDWDLLTGTNKGDSHEMRSNVARGDS